MVTNNDRFNGLATDLLSREFGGQKLQDLNFVDDPITKNVVQLIRESLAQATPSVYSVINAIYSPITADLAICGPDQRVAFVEMKTSKCKQIKTFTDSQGNAMTMIAHVVAHNDVSQPIFVHTSGRWTYLFTELLRENGQLDRFTRNGKVYARRMVLLHRLEIPAKWSYQDSANGWLTGAIPSSSIIHLDTTPQHVASQIASILECHPFALPELEEMEQLSHSQLLYGTMGLKHDAKNRQGKLHQVQHKFSGAEQIRLRKPEWVFQAETSLRILQHCRKA